MDTTAPTAWTPHAIKLAIDGRGWTPEVAASELGFTVRTVKNWIAGRNSPDVNALDRVFGKRAGNERTIDDATTEQLLGALVTRAISNPGTPAEITDMTLSLVRLHVEHNRTLLVDAHEPFGADSTSKRVM